MPDIWQNKRAGGILSDWEANDDWYFRNCQYLSADCKWFNLLPQENLIKFPVNMAHMRYEEN